MKWKEFKESSKEYPEVIIQNFISGFADATGNLAELGITPKSEIGSITSKMNSKFQFDLVLFSKHLEEYSFTVLEFGYNIELFPVTIVIETSILNELRKKTQTNLPKMVQIETEDILRQILESIFQTERFEEVVSGLMKIAKKSDVL